MGIFYFKGKILEQTKANAILAFTADTPLIPLAEELRSKNITDKIWIASEAWVNSPTLSSGFSDIFEGTVGTALPSGQMPGFLDFLRSVRPQKSKHYETEHDENKGTQCLNKTKCWTYSVEQNLNLMKTRKNHNNNKKKNNKRYRV